MALHHAQTIAEAQALLGGTSSPVVVVPVYNAPEETTQCLNSILTHTLNTCSILIVDDCGADRTFFNAFESAQFVHNVVILHLEKNQGFIGACNSAFEATGNNDVILVNSDVIVGPT